MYLFPTVTATKVQTAAYLFGVALFSISFLVFLNASISFVVTDVIGRKERVGDAVGTLGFADELLALVACPLWGVLSDRIGVRNVAVIGYIIIAVSFFVLVQSQNVYPQLLLARLFFSIGGAACSTMVTAMLPTLTMKRQPERKDPDAPTEDPPEERTHLRSASNDVRHSGSFSISSQLTITPARYKSTSPRPNMSRRKSSALNILATDSKKSDTESRASSQLAGYVGMFTGIGALLAVLVFLPLPATIGGSTSITKKQAVKDSFYIVGCVALLVGVAIFFGLRGIPGDQDKGFRNLYASATDSKKKQDDPAAVVQTPTYSQLAKEAVVLAFTDSRIALGYIGGFVARGSSVAISLFVPLFVNAYFIRQGLCTEEPGDDIKTHCRRAYTLASMLTGFAELAALLCAPIFGWFSSRMVGRGALSNLPLGVGAVAGILGSVSFALVEDPDPFSEDSHGSWVVLSVILLGISQIAAIVCSLGLLAKGIQSAALPNPSPDAESSYSSETPLNNAIHESAETAPLIAPTQQCDSTATLTRDRTHFKGTIAGMYSLLGGAGILILTKLGGVLFDQNPGSPFILLAGFNGLLLVAVLGVATAQHVRNSFVL